MNHILTKCIYILEIYTKQNINHYQLFRERTELKYLNDSKAFIEYSIDMDDIYKNIEEYNPNKKGKILIIFYDLMTDMLSNKKLIQH